MTTFVQEYSAVLLRTETLEVKLATTFAEIDAALRLRFEVFNLELQEGLLASYERGFDADVYDAYCDHLIVKDLSTNKVVGTYRLLRQSVAELEPLRSKRLTPENVRCGDAPEPHRVPPTRATNR